MTTVDSPALARDRHPRTNPLWQVQAEILKIRTTKLWWLFLIGVVLVTAWALLRNGASPNLPADYLDAIDRLKPDPDVGTCAAAAATGQVVVTPDFCADRRWSELRHLPMALGFLSAWSMPIKNGDGRVLGTFGTYFRVRREPSQQERETVGRLAPIAAVALSGQAA